MISLQDAVDDLYRIVVVETKSTSNKRLTMLADYCIEQLNDRGIVEASKELSVPGIGRDKKWDIVWPAEGRVRLGISLKSMLSNISGAVPNRIDELAGEMANVQLMSPEIVTGYIMIFDTSKSGVKQDGTPWVDVFRDAVNRLSGRDAPAWAAGMMEASVIVEVDFSEKSRIMCEPNMSEFFSHLANCVKARNPDSFR